MKFHERRGKNKGKKKLSSLFLSNRPQVQELIRRPREHPRLLRSKIQNPLSRTREQFRLDFRGRRAGPLSEDEGGRSRDQRRAHARARRPRRGKRQRRVRAAPLPRSGAAAASARRQEVCSGSEERDAGARVCVRIEEVLTVFSSLGEQAAAGRSRRRRRRLGEDLAQGAAASAAVAPLRVRNDGRARLLLRLSRRRPVLYEPPRKLVAQRQVAAGDGDDARKPPRARGARVRRRVARRRPLPCPCL